MCLYFHSRVKKNKARIPHISGRSLDRGTIETDKARILRTGDYGYAHVWELQHLRPGQDPPPNDLDLTSGHNDTGTLPNHAQPEFGAHLLKCPKTATYRPGDPHSYESPRFFARDPITGQYLTGTMPVYHAYTHGGDPLPAIAHDHTCGLATEPRRASVADGIDAPVEDSLEARYTN